jgi:hypothetical protein
MNANGAATTLDEAVDKLPGAPNTNRIKGILETFVAQTSNDATAFRSAVEKHFDAVMDRASGWVKRRQQKVAFWVAAILATVANVDTIVLATSLASNPEAREKMVAIAQDRLADAKAGEKKIEEQVKNNNGADEMTGRGERRQSADPAKPNNQRNADATSDDTLAQAKRQTEAALNNVREAETALQSAGLPMGWKEWPAPAQWPTKIVGLLVSIFAVSLGAPFWFDILQRVMRVRQSGVSPREKK